MGTDTGLHSTVSTSTSQVAQTRVANIRSQRTFERPTYGARPAGRVDPRSVPPGAHGFLGNPFLMGPDGTREDVVNKFRAYFHQRLEDDPAFYTAVRNLRGRTLLCFCKPRDCHLDVVAEWLNSLD
jgi:hypothetical protein